MSTVFYEMADGMFECSRISSGDDGKIKLVFSPDMGGSVCLGSSQRLYKNGAEFDTGMLPCGVIAPLYASDEGSFICEPIMIADGAAHFIPKDDAYLRRLGTRLCTIEKKIRELEEKEKKLSTAIYGQKIF